MTSAAVDDAIGSGIAKLAFVNGGDVPAHSSSTAAVDELHLRHRSMAGAQHDDHDGDLGDDDDDDDDNNGDAESKKATPSDDFHFVSFDAAASPNCVAQCIARYVPSLAAVLRAFGVLPVASLALVYFLIKGVAVTAVNLALLPLFKSAAGLGLTDAAEYQRFSTVAALAWPLKPVIGLISDEFPVRGYRKRFYLFGAAVAVTALMLLIAVLPHRHDADPASVVFVTGLLFLSNLCFATIDLLCEAVYSRFYILRPKAGSAVVSLCWSLVMSAGIFAAPLVGPLADKNHVFVPFAIVAALTSLAIYPFYRNWFSELPQPQQKKVTGAVTAHRLARLPTAESAEVEASEERVGGGDSSAVVADEADETEMTATAAPASAAAEGDGNNSNNNNSALKANLRKQAIAAGIISPLTALASLVLHHQHHRPATSATSAPDAYAGPALNCSAVRASNSASSNISADWLRSLALQYHHDKASGQAAQVVERMLVPVVAASILLYCAQRFLPPRLFRVFIYMFLNEALYLSTSGALDYFFVADAQCLPDGPNFSFTFYQTTTTAVSSVFGAIGAWAFYRYLSDMNFQLMFALTTLLKVAASFFDIVIAQRWNRLFMSDRGFFMLGESMLLPVAQSLSFMPAVMLTAHSCPVGLEATTYALLAGMSNFGMSISGLIGSVMTLLFGIRTSPLSLPCITSSNISSSTVGNATSWSSVVVGPCDFSNLGWLIFVSHCVCPLMTLPLIKALVPDSAA